jgi:hypothetical protein
MYATGTKTSGVSQMLFVCYKLEIVDTRRPIATSNTVDIFKEKLTQEVLSSTQLNDPSFFFILCKKLYKKKKIKLI